jgi:hypothetical protein
MLTFNHDNKNITVHFIDKQEIETILKGKQIIAFAKDGTNNIVVMSLDEGEESIREVLDSIDDGAIGEHILNCTLSGVFDGSTN